MPPIAPPRVCPGNPVTTTLDAGRTLARVHDATRPSVAFNPTVAVAPAPGAPLTGGRFDTTTGAYAYSYVAMSMKGAFAEYFARNLDYTRAGPRPVPLARIARRSLSMVRLRRPVALVEIQGAAAQQLGQDDWLTRCDEGDYPITRLWAEQIRQWIPAANGLIWRSKRDPDQQVMVLWGDPATAPTGCGLLAKPAGTSALPLDAGPGRRLLEQFLVQWRLYLES